MSNWSRKVKRKGIKHPRCCGIRMKWKDSISAWVCVCCGRERKARKGTLKYGEQI